MGKDHNFMTNSTSCGLGWLIGWRNIAAYIGVHPRTVRRWTQTGAFPVRVLHNRVVALPGELDAWLIYATDIKNNKQNKKQNRSS